VPWFALKEIQRQPPRRRGRRDRRRGNAKKTLDRARLSTPPTPRMGWKPMSRECFLRQIKKRCRHTGILPVLVAKGVERIHAHTNLGAFLGVCLGDSAVALCAFESSASRITQSIPALRIFKSVRKKKRTC